MPHVKITNIVWGVNTLHATRRATAGEIEEVFANDAIIGKEPARASRHTPRGWTHGCGSPSSGRFHLRGGE